MGDCEVYLAVGEGLGGPEPERFAPLHVRAGRHLCARLELKPRRDRARIERVADVDADPPGRRHLPLGAGPCVEDHRQRGGGR